MSSGGQGDGGQATPLDPCVVANADGGSVTRVRVDEALVLNGAAAELPSGSTVMTRQWSVQHMPPGATLAFAQRGSAVTEVWSNGEPGLAVAGAYVLAQELHGADGSQASVGCVLDVAPRAGLTVELTWPTAAQDLDLHLLQELADGGVLLDSPQDCNFANCQPGASSLRWGNPDAGTSNPLLARSGDEGFGPERVELDVPPPGAYRVWVHHFSANGAGPVEGHLVVHAHGRPVAQFVTSALAEDARADVVRIVAGAPGQPICVEEVATGTRTCVDATPVTCTPGMACGPGMTCKAASGLCEPELPGCPSAGCGSGRACQPATQACVEAQCDAQQACDAPQQCVAEELRCQALPAVCTDTGEPNNDTTTATPMTVNAAQHTAHMGNAPLCRGDVDVFSFPVAQDARVQVRLTLASGVTGLSAALLSQDGAVLAESSAAGATTTLTAYMAAGSQAYVSLKLDSAAAVDQVDCTLDATMEVLPTCGTESGEPNNTLATASTITGTHAAQLTCSGADEDYLRFSAPAHQRVAFTLSAAAPLLAEILTTAGVVLAQQEGGTTIRLQAATGLAAEDWVLHVSPADPLGTFPVAYSVDLETQAPPTCADSALEPNDTLPTAHAITASPVAGVACDAHDDDDYAFTLAAAADVDLLLHWADTTADLDFYVMAADGTTLDAAASADNPEALGPLHLEAGTYVVRVQPASVGAAAVPYTLEFVGWP